MSRCEDYPCCGHTPDDPCGPQDYDRPGFYDTTVKGNEHALCDHENGDCDVPEPDEDDDEGYPLHAHVESSETDCDGRMDRNWIVDLLEDEEDSDLESRVVAGVVNLSADGGKLEVSSGEEHGRPWSRLSWYEPTDEGRKYVEVTFCRDGCDLTEHGQRDHQAEAAGY